MTPGETKWHYVSNSSGPLRGPRAKRTGGGALPHTGIRKRTLFYASKERNKATVGRRGEDPKGVWAGANG